MTRQPGFVLVTALLLTLMLSLVSLGTLAAGARELRIATAHHRRAEAILRVESAVGSAVRGWSTHDHAALEVGSSTSVPPPAPGAAVDVTRLDSSLYLVRAREVATAGGPPPLAARRAVLVSVFDPRRVSAAFPAAVTATDVDVSAGSISGHDPCGDAGPAVWAGALDAGAGAVLSGFPTTVGADPPPMPVPSPFDPRVAPVLGGVSATVPFVHVAGPRTLVGETLDGILVVDGDLRLIDTGVRGLVVVSGTLTIDGASQVSGAVRASRLRMRDGRIQRDGCALEHVLAGSPLDHPFRPERRWWIPVY